MKKKEGLESSKQRTAEQKTPFQHREKEEAEQDPSDVETLQLRVVGIVKESNS